MRTIRWGMIGCGDVAEVKSGPGFYKADNSTLVAVMRRNGALAQDFARRHKVPRWHDDADAIINADDIDAVYIATLTDTHLDYALRCARAGKPIYVEKPMAMDHAQCRTMIDAAKAAKVPLWVGYYRRALPRFLKVKELLDSGAIGDVRIVTSRLFAKLFDPGADTTGFGWRADPKLSGGGIFFEGACHTLDFLDFLFGPIEDVRGFAANKGGKYPAEDLITCAYRFSSGVIGQGTWCYAADYEYEMNEVVGATGRIQFSTTAPVPIRVLRGDSVEEIAIGDPPHVHQPLIQTIVDEMNGKGQCPSTGESGARTARSMDQLLGEFYGRKAS
jgi:predicted dehydrogenase